VEVVRKERQCGCASGQFVIDVVWCYRRTNVDPPVETDLVLSEATNPLSTSDRPFSVPSQVRRTASTQRPKRASSFDTDSDNDDRDSGAVLFFPGGSKNRTTNVT